MIPPKPLQFLLIIGALALIYIRPSYSQDLILEEAQEFFNDLSEEETEHWISLLQQWKDEQWKWPEHIEKVSTLPWVDESWITSTLLGLNAQEVQNMLNHPYKDAASSETIKFLYEKLKLRKTLRKKIQEQKVHFSVRSAARTVAFGKSYSAAYDIANQFRVETEHLQLHWNQSKAARHSNSYLFTNQFQPKGVQIHHTLHQSQIRLTYGAMRYQFGSGLIGNVSRRSNLSAIQSVSRYSDFIRIWSSKDVSAALHGLGLEFNGSIFEISFLRGMRNWITLSNQDLESYTSVSRASIWSQTSKREVKNSVHSSLYLRFKPNAQFAVGLGLTHSDFGTIAYQNKPQKNRYDAELNLHFVLSKSALWRAHIASYEQQMQYQSYLQWASPTLRIRWVLHRFQQSEHELIRRINLIKGSFGIEHLQMLNTDVYRKNGAKLFSFNLSHLNTSNPWSIHLSERTTFFLESIVYARLSNRFRYRLTGRFQQTIDTEVNKTERLMRWMLVSEYSVTRQLKVRTNFLMYSSDHKLMKPSLHLAHRISYNSKKTEFSGIFSKLHINADSPMQRMDTWSASHLIRDVFVRNASGITLQLRLAYALSQLSKISLSVSRQFYDSLQFSTMAQKKESYSFRTLFNLDFRLLF